MKKINLLTLSLISVIALAGCDGTSPLAKNLEALRKGFVVEGTINQKAKYLDGYDGAYTGEVDEANFTFKYVFENDERDAISREFLGVEEDGSKYNVLKNDFVRGEDGHVYFTELSHQNKVVETAAVNSSVS